MDVRITLRGTTSLIAHNPRTANPFDPLTRAIKALTSKRIKTEADHIEIARLEHMAGLYMDDVVGPYIPGQNIERCLLDAARVTKAGKKIERGLFVSTDVNPLSYVGPRDTDGLWADENFRDMSSVKVGVQRVMRCRPIFHQWSTSADGTLDPAVLSLDELGTIAETAGLMIGMCDRRPRYGRFTSVVEKL